MTGTTCMLIVCIFVYECFSHLPWNTKTYHSVYSCIVLEDEHYLFCLSIIKDYLAVLVYRRCVCFVCLIVITVNLQSISIVYIDAFITHTSYYRQSAFITHTSSYRQSAFITHTSYYRQSPFITHTSYYRQSLIHHTY